MEEPSPHARLKPSGCWITRNVLEDNQPSWGRSKDSQSKEKWEQGLGAVFQTSNNLYGLTSAYQLDVSMQACIFLKVTVRITGLWPPHFNPGILTTTHYQVTPCTATSNIIQERKAKTQQRPPQRLLSAKADSDLNRTHCL